MRKRNVKLIFKDKPEQFSSKDSIAWWQGRSAEDRLNAVWELVETAWELKGKNKNELRFQRSVMLVKRI